ncbi:prolyl oligopeptidase family serine peptidase [Pseudoalteromonas sp. PAR1]|uniref:prolyl oligopeptidase family serine peptidase n=1 Tax=Pseudoalteromonas sp. PAR1 TaxID=2853443 RepID=UPI00248B271E|nr:prolyl oligopeptidase family serine peptidase [Pseudoalteromonas sp. PAR1]
MNKTTKITAFFTNFVMLSILLINQVSAQDIKPKDEFIWLEEISSIKSKSWVGRQNAITKSSLSSQGKFKDILARSYELQKNGERLPNFLDYKMHNDFIYKVLQNETSPRGVLVRKNVNQLPSKEQWEQLVNLDKIAAEEGQNWYFSMHFLRFSPDGKRLLVSLSDGGSDAITYREFDLVKKQFIKTKNFNTDLKRTFVEWLSNDKLVVVTSFDENERTDSHYPRVVRLWNRGEKLEESEIIFSAKKVDTLVGLTSLHGFDDKTILLSVVHDFSNASFQLLTKEGTLSRIELPSFFGVDFSFSANSLNKKIIATLPKEWVRNGKKYESGTLVAIELEVPMSIKKDESIKYLVDEIFVPEDNQAVNKYDGVGVFNNSIYLNVLEDVVSKLFKMSYQEDGSSNSNWSKTEISIPSNGTLTLPSFSSPESHFAILRYENLITQPQEYLLGSNDKLKKIGETSQVLREKDFTVKRVFVTASDGVKVPYFVAYKKDSGLKLRDRPVLMYGYGGFGIPTTPAASMAYLGVLQPMWLDNNGIFVIASVRGGGEYGPKWHDSAKRTKRQRVYDDYYTITEDLIAKGYGRAGKIAFIGGSNGGLTAGVLPTQRPDLFGATISLVPLLDMERFHKLLAGASWVDEYGSPENPVERESLLKYSPYHNLHKDKKYPPMFIMTSTKDDRVHPGHARKMAAKMQKQGHEVYFYEAAEGGHFMAINDEGRAYNTAMQMTFLTEALDIH